MAGKFEGRWKLKVLHQHVGTDLFLGDLAVQVDSYTGSQFSFLFLIHSTVVAVTLTEKANDSFEGTFTEPNNSEYNISGDKRTHQDEDFIIGVINKHPAFPQTDVISYTAIKTG